MFSNLRIKLSLSHLLVIILAMILTAFLLLSLVENYLMDSMEKSIKDQASITAQALIPRAIGGNTSRIRFYGTESDMAAAFNAVQQITNYGSNSIYVTNATMLGDIASLNAAGVDYLEAASLQLSTQLETRIRILDVQGIVLVDSQKENETSNIPSNSLIARALKGQISIMTNDINGEDYMHVACPVLLENQPIGIVYLSHSLKDTTAVLHDLRTRLLISAGIALLLSGIVALLLSRMISNPIRRLTAAAGAVTSGQYSQQVPVNSKDEIGQLSHTFNEMTSRIQSAHQMQVDFVANVSHESRTPLTSLKGMVETLRDGAVEDTEVRDRFLSTMESEIDRLIRLVNDLLFLSRADSKALDLQREAIYIADLVQGVVEKFAQQANARGLTLKMGMNQALPKVLVDPDGIEQVLINLLDNALKYSRSGGTVTIRVAAGQDKSVLVQVCDEGIGISSTDLPRIGERFYRTDKARSRAEGGSGLGIAIARALIEAHGGRLWLESVEGQGTIVSFTLPTL